MHMTKRCNPNFLGIYSPSWFKGYDPKCNCKACKEVREGRFYIHECSHYDYDRDLCRLGYHWEECGMECKDLELEGGVK